MAVARAHAVKVVGRYQLAHEIAASYLGPLWAVRVEGSDGSATLAMLRLVSLSRLDADTRVRLLEAAWQAMEVRHDGIYPVTDVVASDGELSVVSEYAEGLPLRAIQGVASVRRKPMPPDVALRIVTDLAAAVAALHQATIELGDEAVPLYGGLSADSVYVGTDGRAVILDVAVSAVAATVEALGGSSEKTAYAAPEQLGQPPVSDARSDVFTLGVIAWELLSGRRLFVGSDKGLAQKVLTAKIPRVDELRRKGDPEVPASVLAVVMRSLEREPAARFQTVEEFSQALADTGVKPAEPAGVGAYLASVGDGALARVRDALRDPSKVRAAAAPWGKLKAPEPKKPAEPAKPAIPVRGGATPQKVLAKPLARGAGQKPAIPVQKTPAAAQPSLSAIPAPAAVTREPEHAGVRPRQPTMIGIPLPGRGTVPPALTPEPVPATTPVVATGEPPATPIDEMTELLGNAVVSVRPPPVVLEAAAAPAAEPEPEFPGDGDEEPTAQYDAKALLRQVESIGRRAEPAAGAAMDSDPPTRPRDSTDPDGTPDMLDAATVAPSAHVYAELPPMMRARLPTLDEPGEGDWLDDAPPHSGEVPTDPKPPAAPFATRDELETLDDDAANSPEGGSREHEPLPPEPRRVSPAPAPAFPAPSFPVRSVEKADARADKADARVEKAEARVEKPVFSRPPPAAAPPAYLPSQIPPPLIHDPRANRRLSARPAPGAPQFNRGVALGVAVSLGLVVLSAGIALVALRGHDPGEAPRTDTTVAATHPDPSGVVAAPPTVAEPQAAAPVDSAPAAEVQPSASAAAPPPSAEAAPASAEAPPTVAEPPASAAATATAPSAVAKVAVAAPATPPPAPRAAPATPQRAGSAAPKAQKKPPKKHGNFVPDDI